MRLSICVLLTLLVALKTNAQFKKGDKFVGTSVFNGVLTSGTSEQSVASIGIADVSVKRYSFSITPALGLFVSNHVVVGGSLLFNPSADRNRYKTTAGTAFQEDHSTQWNLGLGGFVRHYWESKTAWIPFLHAGVNFGWAKAASDGFFYGGSGASVYKETYDSKSSKGVFLNAVANVGMTRMLGPNAGLDISLGYGYSVSRQRLSTIRLRDDGVDGTNDFRFENNTTSRFSLNNFQIGLGFQVFLRGK